MFLSHVKQSILYSVWKSILKLRDSVTVRRIDVQLLQQDFKLYYILKEQADTVAVKNALSSAIDVMQALSSSILHLLSKVEGRTSLVSKLSDMAGQKKFTLGECRELLCTAAKLQVQESSLHTHLMQLREGVLG
ncbi:hypothetical protein ABZP36_024429 [Zizania latifolia]